MNINDIATQIEIFVAENQEKDAIEFILSINEINALVDRSSLILLLSRLNETKKKAENGLISENQTTLRINRIRSIILYNVEKIRKSEKKHLKTNQYWNLNSKRISFSHFHDSKRILVTIGVFFVLSISLWALNRKLPIQYLTPKNNDKTISKEMDPQVSKPLEEKIEDKKKLNIDIQEKVSGNEEIYNFGFTNISNDIVRIEKYWVQLSNSKVNITPELEFKLISPNSFNSPKSRKLEELELQIRNIGWGKVLDCSCSFDYDGLKRPLIFSKPIGQFPIIKSKVSSSEYSSFAKFTINGRIRRHYMRENKENSFRTPIDGYIFKKRVSKITLPKIKCSYRDENGGIYSTLIPIQNNLFMTKTKDGIVDGAEIKNKDELNPLRDSIISQENSKHAEENLNMYPIDFTALSVPDTFTIRYDLLPEKSLIFPIVITPIQSGSSKIRFYFKTESGEIHFSKPFYIKQKIIREPSES